MLPHNIFIEQNKYCVVKHCKTSKYYATFLQDWQKVSQHREQQMAAIDNGIEIVCYKLLLDTPTNCYWLTDEISKLYSSELRIVPITISQ